MVIEQTYRTERGRTRRRSVVIDLDQLRRTLDQPAARDRHDWQRIRELVAQRLDENTFAIWVAPLELIATDSDCVLLVSCPPRLAGWIQQRFWPLITRCAEQVGRESRVADETRRAAMLAGPGTTASSPSQAGSRRCGDSPARMRAVR